MALYGNLYEIFIDRKTRDGLGYGTCIYSGQEYERQDFYGLFGGLFYIGIILSIVFLLAAVLIIYQSFLQSASKYALTKESELQGKKTKGGDAYVGSYTAGYDNFDGTEYIFGATGLERAAGSELTVTYTLRIASVIWDHSGSQYTLARVEGQGTHELTLGSGDNYIVLKGEGLTGSLELEVK